MIAPATGRGAHTQSVFITRPPNAERLRRLHREQSQADVTYSHAGATRDAEFPAGYHHDRYEISLGHGDEVFRRGVEGLRRWVGHEGAGVRVTPADAAIEEGSTVVMVLPLGPLRALASCRVLYVVDEPERFGFAYGTLPLHPEQGEESFFIERDNDDTVWFRVAAFSRPAALMARLGSPVSRVIQRRVTNGYLRAMKGFVAESSA